MAAGIAAGNAAGTPTYKARERLLRRGPMLPRLRSQVCPCSATHSLSTIENILQMLP